MINKKIKAALLFTTLTLSASYSLANAVDDTAITAEVKTKLILEKDIPANNIEVTTVDNVVNLKGIVDTQLQAHKAIEIASSIDKVIDVNDSNLRVKDSKTVISDSLITAKVKGKIRHLYTHKNIADGYDLHVETTNHIVHIFGEVARPSDIDVITAAAKEVKNVKEVKTNIRVKNS